MAPINVEGAPKNVSDDKAEVVMARHIEEARGEEKKVYEELIDIRKKMGSRVQELVDRTSGQNEIQQQEVEYERELIVYTINEEDRVIGYCPLIYLRNKFRGVTEAITYGDGTFYKKEAKDGRWCFNVICEPKEGETYELLEGAASDYNLAYDSNYSVRIGVSQLIGGVRYCLTRTALDVSKVDKANTCSVLSNIKNNTQILVTVRDAMVRQLEMGKVPEGESEDLKSK